MFINLNRLLRELITYYDKDLLNEELKKILAKKYWRYVYEPIRDMINDDNILSLKIISNHIIDNSIYTISIYVDDKLLETIEIDDLIISNKDEESKENIISIVTEIIRSIIDKSCFIR